MGDMEKTNSTLCSHGLHYSLEKIGGRNYTLLLGSDPEGLFPII